MLFLFDSNRYTVQRTRVKMNSQVQGDMLRCWKCRKYVANSDCLINDQTADLVFEVSKKYIVSSRPLLEYVFII